MIGFKVDQTKLCLMNKPSGGKPCRKPDDKVPWANGGTKTTLIARFEGVPTSLYYGTPYVPIWICYFHDKAITLFIVNCINHYDSPFPGGRESEEGGELTEFTLTLTLSHQVGGILCEIMRKAILVIPLFTFIQFADYNTNVPLGKMTASGANPFKIR